MKAKRLSPITEGDARKGHHAKTCSGMGCKKHCRCWCHAELTFRDGTLRPDARETKQQIRDGKIKGLHDSGIRIYTNADGKIVITEP